MADKMAFEAAARREIEGPAHYFDSLVETDDTGKKQHPYYFHPRKYSVKGRDAIRACDKPVTEGIPIGLQKKLAKIMEENPEISNIELLEMLPAEEVEVILRSQQEKGGTFDLYRTTIFYGCGKNNLMGTVKDGLTEEEVERVLEYGDVAIEMFGTIRTWNRPLAHRRSRTSETLPNGTSTELSTPPEPSSKTAESPGD